jgi:hypothetical protein
MCQRCGALNRRVLREYSDSMKALLRNGYGGKLRPSGNDISTKFQIDRGGSIPPNVLEFSNTESNNQYLRACKERGIKPHRPASLSTCQIFSYGFLRSPVSWFWIRSRVKCNRRSR